VGEHLCCASESLLAHVARDVQELVDGVRVFGLPPDLDLVGHRVVELHVFRVDRAGQAMADAPTRGGRLSGRVEMGRRERVVVIARRECIVVVVRRERIGVVARRECIIVVARRVVTSHLIRRREQAVVTVAEVATHVFFVHGGGWYGLTSAQGKQANRIFLSS
jgi:hypothetical protein